MFDALGVPLFEMRCCSCNETQQIQSNRFKSIEEPIFTRCCSCKEYLVVYPNITYKPNNTLFSLEVVKVPSPSKKPVEADTPKSTLSVVSNLTNINEVA